MLLEYSGRHLAMVELAAFMKLLLDMSLIGCVFLPWPPRRSRAHSASTAQVAQGVDLVGETGKVSAGSSSEWPKLTRSFRE
jgi:formate hydrogenlyase subunit 4